MLYDPHPATLAASKERITRQLATLVEHGLITQAPDIEQLELVDRLTPDLACDFVQESAPERYDVKTALYQELDRCLDPGVPVASSSSGLLISRLQTGCRYPQRYLIAHPFNPPHLIPLVELVPGPHTDPQITERVYNAFKAWGKSPILLKKEVPGHVANRLAAALWREAISLVAEGVASVGDVDRALCDGPGLRWALMGAHLTYHLGGGTGGIRHFWEHLGPAFETYFADLDRSTTLSADALDLLEKGITQEVGDRSIEELARWRDATLIQLLKVRESSRAGQNDTER